MEQSANRRYHSAEELTAALKDDLRRAGVYLSRPLHILKVLAYLVFGALNGYALYWMCWPQNLVPRMEYSDFARRHPLITYAQDSLTAISASQWCVLLTSLLVFAFAVLLYFRGHTHFLRNMVLLCCCLGVCGMITWMFLEKTVGNTHFTDIYPPALTARDILFCQFATLCSCSMSVFQICFDIFHHWGWRKRHPRFAPLPDDGALSVSSADEKPIFRDVED